MYYNQASGQFSTKTAGFLRYQRGCYLHYFWRAINLNGFVALYCYQAFVLVSRSYTIGPPFPD